MMEPPRALRLLFAFLAVSASQPQQPGMAAAAAGALALATAVFRARGAQEAFAVAGAGARPDDLGFHRAMPGARHHHAANKWVVVGVVIAVVVVVLGALGVGIYCLCARKRRRRMAAPARELPPRAPPSPPWVQLPPEPHGGRDEVAVDIPGAATVENNGCRLCRRPYAGLEGDEAPHTLTCGDRFHRRCIRRWVRENLSCPICNASQIVLLGVGATGGETSRRYSSTSSFGIQIRDDSIVGRSTFSF